jgi:hypothetical protein
MRGLARALLVLASIAAIGGSAAAGPSPEEATVSPSADPPALEPADGSADPPEDAGTAPPAPPRSSIRLSGGLDCELSSGGEASTSWRHGRKKSGKAINEIAHRVTVGGVATCAGRWVEFSASVVVPSLRVGAYGLGPEGVVSVWARADRTVAKPDMAWDTSAGGAGQASLLLVIASMRETTGKYEWRDGVAVDVKNFEIEGTIRATVPCVPSTSGPRRRCLAEVVTGTF